MKRKRNCKSVNNNDDNIFCLGIIQPRFYHQKKKSLLKLLKLKHALRTEPLCHLSPLSCDVQECCCLGDLLLKDRLGGSEKPCVLVQLAGRRPLLPWTQAARLGAELGPSGPPGTVSPPRSGWTERVATCWWQGVFAVFTLTTAFSANTSPAPHTLESCLRQSAVESVLVS